MRTVTVMEMMEVVTTSGLLRSVCGNHVDLASVR